MAMEAFFFMILLAISHSARVPQPDLNALLAIKNQISDPFNYLAGWTSTNDCASWGGLVCDRTSGRVIYLNMGYGSHSGKLPSSFNSLTELKSLFLEGNFFTGVLPNLSSLKKLTIISLTGNDLTGNLQALGSLTSLRQLYASTNKFTGGIPSVFASMSNLSRLELSNNKLSGSIPSFLGNLQKLESLLLDFNQLSGSIPPSLGNLAKVKYLNFSSNRLTGGIPLAFSNLLELMDFSLSRNKLRGGIPRELASMRRLRNIDLSHNFLRGPVLGNINSPLFNFFNQDFNYLTGIPAVPLNDKWACARLTFTSNCLDYTTLQDFCYHPQRTSEECRSNCLSNRKVFVACEKCFARNPCGLGQSVNQLFSKNYTCICPRGYRVGTFASSGQATCVPGRVNPSTWVVPYLVDLDCRTLYENVGMSLKTFVKLNTGKSCGYVPLNYGTVMNITVDMPGCPLVYRVNKGDSCSSIARRFKLKAVAGPGSPNPDLDCCNLKAGNKVCVKRGGVPSVYLCQSLYSLGPSETCASVVTNFFKGSHYNFHYFNPEAYCDLLAPKASSRFNIDRRVCVKAIKKTERDANCKDGAMDTVKKAEYCDLIYRKHFGGRASNFQQANSGVICDNSLLYTGLNYCTKY